jgi:hypothetical protein
VLEGRGFKPNFPIISEVDSKVYIILTVATIFRDLSYRYQWLYEAIARLAALSVGG